jgi:hypothetical protein
VHFDRLAELLIETEADEQCAVPVHLQFRSLSELL